MHLDKVYEDDNLMIINKPRGLVAEHGTGVTSTTLQDILQETQPNNLDRGGIVHRLDKNTCGLLIIAKDLETQGKLVEMMKNREIEREYIGLVEGQIHRNGTINKNLIRSPRNRTKYITTETGGRDAITHYEVIELYKKHTLVRFRLETGRTHQIRVHSKSIGHALVGDPEYNPKSSIKVGVQMLESVRLAFIHPITGEKIDITIPPSQLFNEVKKKIS